MVKVSSMYKAISLDLELDVVNMIYDVTFSITDNVLSKNPGYSTSFWISITNSADALVSPT